MPPAAVPVFTGVARRALTALVTSVAHAAAALYDVAPTALSVVVEVAAVSGMKIASTPGGPQRGRLRRTGCGSAVLLLLEWSTLPGGKLAS